MPVPLTLQIFKGHQLVGTRAFHRDIIKIGRLSSAHLSLDDPKLSRIHCVLQVSAEGEVSVLDMGSAEGTFVNGRRMSKGEVRSGDEITLGETRLVLQLGQRAAAMPSAEPAALEVPPPVEPTEAVAAESELGLLDLVLRRGQHGPLTDIPLSHRGRGPIAGSREPTEDGVEVRVFWGETLLGSTLRVRPPAVTLGSTPKADFAIPEDFLATPELAVVQTSKRGTIPFRFTKAMDGEFQPPGQPPTRLSTLVAKGLASFEDGAYSLALPSGSLAWAAAGPLTVEVGLSRAPQRVASPLWDGLDYRFVNLALLMGFAMLAFLIGVATYPFDADTVLDGIDRNPHAMNKFILTQPKKPSNPDRFKLPETDSAAEKAEAPEAAAKKPGTAGTKTSKASGRLASVLTAKQAVMRSAIFQALAPSGPLPDGVGGGRNALGPLLGPSAGDAPGMGGLLLRGGLAGPGGGGFGPNGSFGPIGTKGLVGDALRSGGIHGKKQGSTLDISSPLPSVIGCMDKELVRSVIHEHRNQVKLCYEEELQTHPGLSGKVTVKFVIGANGNVEKSDIDSSSLSDATVERCIENHVSTWLFPKPTCGGVAQIRYPFLLKESGE